MQYTPEQMHLARRTDLHAFLLRHHSTEFVNDGSSLHPKNNKSLSIKKGYSGFKDFATGETGNSVDFLVNHMGYSLPEAVISLCDGRVENLEPISIDNKVENVPPTFPEVKQGAFKHLFAFLKSRGISQDTIQMLIDKELLYQEADRNNIVFINKERDFAELRGTYTYGKAFHGVAKNSRHDGFWWFRTNKDAEVLYVCEASIDAISLYELHKLQGKNEDAYYVSVAGSTGKQPAIDRIKLSKLKVILAVDNDEAGQLCRDNNSECEFILPTHKDWNEDLQAAKKV